MAEGAVAAGNLPAEIEVAELAGGVHYRLPRRPLGGWKWLGLLPIGFGLFFAGFAVAWMIGAATLALAGGLDWSGLLFVLFGLPFVLGGLWVVRLGLLILAGYSEIEVAHGWLHAIERAGPVRWSRRRRIDDIRRLVVKRIGDTDGRQPLEVRHLARLPLDLSAVAVECEKKSTLLAAPGYPHEWLLALAHDLSRRCERANLESPDRTRIVVTDLCDEQAETLQQPAGSNITLEEHADGVTLHVPPAGLWKGSKGLFAFSLLWNGFMTIFTGGFVWALLAGEAGDLNALIFVAFIAAFWAIGMGLMLAGINMGRRRAVLGVVGHDHLLILQTGIFGSKRREWHRDQLEDVRAGPSGIETNGVPIIELQIISRRGKKVGLLAGRDNDELHWLAALLRQSLRLDQPDGARDCGSTS